MDGPILMELEAPNHDARTESPGVIRLCHAQ